MFDRIPDDLILNMFKNEDASALAKWAQISSRFNKLANHNSLKLFKHKQDNEGYSHRIGDLCLIAKKSTEHTYHRETKEKIPLYMVYLTENDKLICEIPQNSAYALENRHVSKKLFDELVSAMKKDTFSLIYTIMKILARPSNDGLGRSRADDILWEIARRLEQAFEQKNKAVIKLK